MAAIQLAASCGELYFCRCCALKRTGTFASESKACGFQILCRRNETKEVDLKVANDPKGPRWEKFLACLTEQGYFKGEVEGSKLYQVLLKKAKHQFSEAFAGENRDDPGQVIVMMLKDAKIDVEKMREEKLLPEDDNSWLNLTNQDLEDMLSKYSDPNSRETGELAGEDTAKSNETSVDLDSVTRSLKSFVDKVSSYEGAEFPRDCEVEEVQFDANSFMDTVGNLLGHGIRSRDDASESDSDDEDMETSSEEEKETEQGFRASTLSSDDDKEMKSYMDQMDEELAQTTIGESFEKRGNVPQGTGHTQDTPTSESQEASAEDTPVDVDFNLVKNILESFSTQQGIAGPASNILNSMGVWLPPDTDLADST